MPPPLHRTNDSQIASDKGDQNDDEDDRDDHTQIISDLPGVMG
jgi:hypothetical protein